MEYTKKILLIDKKELIFSGVRDFIRRIPGFVLIDHHVKDYNKANTLINKLKPNIVIIGIDYFPSISLDIARKIFISNLPTKVIFFYNKIPQKVKQEASLLNVIGFLLKSSSLNEFKKCLDEVMIGNKYYDSKSSSNKSKTQNLIQLNSNPIQYDLPKILSKSEKKVLKLITLGKSSKEIADTLFNSRRTIESHRYKIVKKLGLSGNHSLIFFAIENKNLILAL